MHLYKDKVIAVFGATGSIGSAICEELTSTGHSVVGIARNANKLRGMLELGLIAYELCVDLKYSDEALSSSAVGEFREHLAGIVYAVGDCPPGGFDQAVTRQFSTLLCRNFEAEYLMHVRYLQAVLFWLTPLVLEKAHIVVINSNITSYSPLDLPEGMFAGHYAVAKAAQEMLVNWWKKEPVVRERLTSIHLIKPPAVDTPFHENTTMRPPRLMPVKTVTQAVQTCFTLDTHSTWVPDRDTSSLLVQR